VKILVLNPNLKGIGTYVRSFYISRELARHGHQVTMVTVASQPTTRPKIYFKKDWLHEAAEPEGSGPWFRIVEGASWGYKMLPGWGAGPIDIAWRVREIRLGNYDVVYGFEYHPNISWPVYLTRGFIGFRFLSDWCDWYAGGSNYLQGNYLAHKIDAYFEERIRHQAEKVTVISKVLEERALSIGIPASKIVHLPEGVASEYFGKVSREQARQQLGISTDVPVLFTSRDWEFDRQMRLIGRVAGLVPEAIFIFVGKTAAEGAELAQQLGVTGRVIFTGWVSDEDYPCYIAAADLCFLPLRDSLIHRARWPAKILDFLAAGRAVVTNDVGEVGRLFHQREVGLLVGSEEVEFAEGIAKLLNDRGRCEMLGEQARQVILAEWDWQVMGPKIASLVE
jgi:glycosyltransferase involved in cell wall biosynthesis